MYETLEVEREEHLTWLTLDRPDALNALDRTMVDELRDFFWNLAEDVRAFLEKRPAKFEDR